MTKIPPEAQALRGLLLSTDLLFDYCSTCGTIRDVNVSHSNVFVCEGIDRFTGLDLVEALIYK